MPPHNYFHICIEDGRDGGQTRDIFMVPLGGSVQLRNGLRVTLKPHTLNVTPKPNGTPDMLVHNRHTGEWHEFHVPLAQVQQGEQPVFVEPELPYMYNAMPQAFRAPNAAAQHPSHGYTPFVSLEEQTANANANVPDSLQDENGNFGMLAPQYQHNDSFPHSFQNAANFPPAVGTMRAPAYQDVNNSYVDLTDDVSDEEDEDTIYMSFQQPTSFQHGVPAQGLGSTLPRPFALGGGIRRVPVVPPYADGHVNSDTEPEPAPFPAHIYNLKRRQPFSSESGTESDAPIKPFKRRVKFNLAPSTTPASFPSAHAPNPPITRTSSGPATATATGYTIATGAGTGPVISTATGPATATATGPANATATGPGTVTATATTTATASATAATAATATTPRRIYGNKVTKKGQPKPTGPQPADLFPSGSAAADAVAAWEKKKAENRAKRELAERERAERERVERDGN